MQIRQSSPGLRQGAESICLVCFFNHGGPVHSKAEGFSGPIREGSETWGLHGSGKAASTDSEKPWRLPAMFLMGKDYYLPR